MTTLAFSFLCSLPREPLCEIEQKNILLALIYQLSRAILLCKMIEETLHDHLMLSMVPGSSTDFLTGSRVFFLFIHQTLKNRTGGYSQARYNFIFALWLCRIGAK